jgi:hypothetical protein
MSSDIRRISTVLHMRATSVVSTAMGFTVVVLIAVGTGAE